MNYNEQCLDERAWMKTEEWKLCDKFNGVSEFDMEDLIETIEKIIAKVDEMNANAKEA